MKCPPLALVHLLPPVMKEPYRLPYTCWAISFLSGALPHTSHIWSALTLVWCADHDHARPLVDQVKDAVRDIDWDNLTVAWEH